MANIDPERIQQYYIDRDHYNRSYTVTVEQFEIMKQASYLKMKNDDLKKENEELEGRIAFLEAILEKHGL